MLVHSTYVAKATNSITIYSYVLTTDPLDILWNKKHCEVASNKRLFSQGTNFTNAALLALAEFFLTRTYI